MADSYNDQDLYGDYTYEDGETPASLSALIATFKNLRVTSAMIENLAVQDGHIQSVSAGKITAGEILVDSNNLAFNSQWKKDTTGWTLVSGAFRHPSYTFEGASAVEVHYKGATAPTYAGVKLSSAYRILCTPGEYFTASAYYYHDAGATPVDRGVGIEVEWYRQDGTRISTSGYLETPSTLGYYKRIYATGKAPEGAYSVGVYVWLEQNGQIWIAKPQLQKGRFLTPYTDNGTYIGPNGIMTTDLKFSGSLEGATGTFSGSLSGATGSFSGTVSGSEITGSTGQFRRIDMYRTSAGVSPYFTFSTGSSAGAGADAQLVSPYANQIKWQMPGATMRFDIDGLLYVQDVRVTSTATAKTNIRPLNEEYDSLELIDETVYTYHYKNDVDNFNFSNKQAGLIAEGIHPLLKGGDSQTINLYAVTSVLWDAVNKLKKRIEQLEALNAPY